MYTSKNGPRLISTVYSEAKALLEAIGEGGEDGVARWRPANEKNRLSRGAGILLERMMGWLRGASVEALWSWEKGA